MLIDRLAKGLALVRIGKGQLRPFKYMADMGL